MRRLFTLAFLLGSLAGAVRAAEPAVKAPASRTLQARARRIQAGIYEAMRGVDGRAYVGRGGVKSFVTRARVVWAGLPAAELQKKVQALSWLQEGEIEAALFERSAFRRANGLSSFASAMEQVEALKDVPIDRLMPRSYVTRLQGHWRRAARAEARASLGRLIGGDRFPLRAGVRRTLEGHLADLVREVDAAGHPQPETAELARQLGTLRSALAAMVRPDGTLDRIQLERGRGVVTYLFQSPLTRSRNDLTNELSWRIRALHSIAVTFPEEKVR